MAGSPSLKVYDSAGTYQAACKEYEAAAALVSLYGDGSTVRYGHSARAILWTEGADGCAGDSYDGAAATMDERRTALHGGR